MRYAFKSARRSWSAGAISTGCCIHCDCGDVSRKVPSWASVSSVHTPSHRLLLTYVVVHALRGSAYAHSIIRRYSYIIVYNNLAAHCPCTLAAAASLVAALRLAQDLSNIERHDDVYIL